MSGDLRVKPSDVAMAEHRAWRQGMDVSSTVSDHLLGQRRKLLTLGFPAAHPLCEELDRAAQHWAVRFTQMRRDMLEHAQLNMIEVEK